MFDTTRYLLEKEEIQEGKIIGALSRGEFKGSLCSELLFQKARVIKLTPKKTKIDVEWLSGNKKGETETLEKNATILRLTEEVEKHISEMNIRLKVCDFFFKNEEICQKCIEHFGVEYDKKTYHSPTYAFKSYLKNECDMETINKIHSAIQTFYNSLFNEIK